MLVIHHGPKLQLKQGEQRRPISDIGNCSVLNYDMRLNVRPKSFDDESRRPHKPECFRCSAKKQRRILEFWQKQLRIRWFFGHLDHEVFISLLCQKANPMVAHFALWTTGMMNLFIQSFLEEKTSILENTEIQPSMELLHAKNFLIVKLWPLLNGFLLLVHQNPLLSLYSECIESIKSSS